MLIFEIIVFFKSIYFVNNLLFANFPILIHSLVSFFTSLITSKTSINMNITFKELRNIKHANP